MRNNRKKNNDFRGRLEYFDEDGYLYFRIDNKNNLERHLIFTHMISLNNNKESVRRSCIYYQQLDFKVGDICGAFSKYKDGYYRARIIKVIDYDNVEVLYIDDGRKEILPKIELEVLPEAVSKARPLVDTCRISNIEIMDFERYKEVMKELCEYEVRLEMVKDILLNRILSDQYVDKCLVRMVNFNYHEENIRTYFIRSGIAIEKENEFVFVNGNHYEKKDSQKMNKTEETNNENEAIEAEITSESLTSQIQFDIEYTKSVFITSFHSSKEFYVQENTSSMKDKLGEIQRCIETIVEKYENFSDNIFNKRNIYLTKFSEDLLWYRIKILKFNEEHGFLVQYIDWGNSEYKSSLEDFILLTREMGYEAHVLMDEESLAQKCKLNKKLRRLFVKESHLRKFFIREFLEVGKRLKLTYRIKESNEHEWLVTNIHWHQQSLHEIIGRHKNVTTGEETGRTLDHNGSNHEENSFSQSDYEDTNKKVIDYLISGYIDPANSNSRNDQHTNCVDGVNENLENPYPVDYNVCYNCNAVCEGISSREEFREHLITYVVNLKEIWADLGDGQNREMCRNLLQDAVNFPKISDDSSVELGAIYGVKYNEEICRCRLISIVHPDEVCQSSSETHSLLCVHLIDYGPTLNVKFEDLVLVPQNVSALPQSIQKLSFVDEVDVSVNENDLMLRLKPVLENRKARLIRKRTSEDSGTELLDVVLEGRYSLRHALLMNNCIRKIPCEENNPFTCLEQLTMRKDLGTQTSFLSGVSKFRTPTSLCGRSYLSSGFEPSIPKINSEPSFYL